MLLIMQQLHISIHSPHARGDEAIMSLGEVLVDISIHSPHARGDP